MHPDIIELRAFYDTTLGHLAERALRMTLAGLWARIPGERLVGMGYSLPYLDRFAVDTERTFAFMPAGQGAVAWPPTRNPATALVFRLAEAVDRSQDDPAEAAFARLMTPAIKYWVAKLGPAIASEAMECAGGNGYVEEGLLARLARDAQALPMVDGPGNVLCLDVLRVLKRSPEPLEAVLKVIEDGLGPAARSTLNVLRAAAAVAIADEGSARILTEQLAMTVAAATLRRRFPSVIADAFLETRLGKPWRSTYGMLDARFDARAFIDYVFPRM